MRVRLVARRANAPALIDEPAEISLKEIDHLNEGVNAERFAAHLAEEPPAWTSRQTRPAPLATSTAVTEASEPWNALLTGVMGTIRASSARGPSGTSHVRLRHDRA